MRGIARPTAALLAAALLLAVPSASRAQAPAADGSGPAPAAGIAPPPGAARGSVAHLAALCAATPENPLRGEATGLCYGVLIGVGQALGPARPPRFCLPDPAPELKTVAEGFVAWAGAHPQAAGARAADGLLLYAAATWPCPTRGARR